jgi:preprotein translocase subunit SecD
MLEFPRWKYVVIVLVLLLSTLYAMPNIYPQDPSLQISNGSQPVPADMQGKVSAALKAANITPKSIETDASGKVLVRMKTADDQTRANDVVRPLLGEGQSVALNLVSTVPQWLRNIWAKPMPLGLDLQGGVHFLMQVDQKAALEKRMEGTAERIRTALQTEKIPYGSVERLADSSVAVVLDPSADVGKAQTLITNTLASGLALGTNNPYTVVQQGSTLLVRVNEAALQAVSADAVDQNRNVIADRINSLGVAEPVLQRQGTDRLVVELPGLQDMAEAKRQIGATATLEFRAVTGDMTAAAEAERSGVVPPGSKLYRMENGAPILLSKRVLVSGDELLDAQVTPDPKSGMPSVSVTLTGAAGKRMFNHTVNNVNKQLATVYIDRIPVTTKDANGNEVQSSRTQERVIAAPNIAEPFGERFNTTGLTNEQATDLAKQLKSGALAAPMDFVEQGVIGPSLGRENVERGVKAVLYSFIFALVFFLVYYRMFGLITCLALLLQMVMIVAVMSIFGATMSLPGFAGLALSVGMSVDANVLINERIREELRAGVPPKAAIAVGYDRASGTIFDSNMTALLAGIALLAFGTGPLKGFAMTMIIGIMTSLFSAVTVSRALATLIYGKRKKLKSIAI